MPGRVKGPLGGEQVEPFVRRFVSDQPQRVRLALEHLQATDLEPLRRTMITGRGSLHRVGGKSAGLLLARAVLRRPEPLPVLVPLSRHVCTSVYEEFLEHNRLEHLRSLKSEPLETVRREYEEIRRLFRQAALPPDVLDPLRTLLAELGEGPLVVRSSSLLEDSLGTAFSGKYLSLFLSNRGTPAERLQGLVQAMTEIYASVFAPDPLRYRQDRGLLDRDEQMGLLIQQVVGRSLGRFFFPMAAGVAFSRNEYRWSARIRKEDGLVRLVMGLGTRAVQRTGDDFPRLISLTLPQLRPEVTAAEIRRYSQRRVDALDLETGRLVSVPLPELLGEHAYPGLELLLSAGPDLTPPLFRCHRLPAGPVALTFQRFVAESPALPLLGRVLRTLRRAFQGEVDLEFAWENGELYLLQCRPLSTRPELQRVPVPRDVSAERQLFSARRHVPTARLSGIEVIVYVCPRRYAALQPEQKIRVARCVGRLNEVLPPRPYILLGPGRWGSDNLDLGVRVTYADISHTRLLVEIARERGGQVPEVSHGTHFFQDLVEAGIHALPLYPDEPGVVFDERFLLGSPSSLPRLLPEYADLADPLRVIDLPEVTGGLKLEVVMDGEAEQALGFLAP